MTFGILNYLGDLYQKYLSPGNRHVDPSLDCDPESAETDLDAGLSSIDPFSGEAIDVPIEDWIDLHTFDPSETREVLEAYIEAAIIEGYSEIRIIHGKGSFTQKRIVLSFLDSNPHVISYHDAPPESGGIGATIATLKGA